MLRNQLLCLKVCYGKILRVYDQIVIKNVKKRRDEYEKNYRNLDVKDELQIELIVSLITLLDDRGRCARPACAWPYSMAE